MAESVALGDLPTRPEYVEILPAAIVDALALRFERELWGMRCELEEMLRDADAAERRLSENPLAVAFDGAFEAEVLAHVDALIHVADAAAGLQRAAPVAADDPRDERELGTLDLPAVETDAGPAGEVALPLSDLAVGPPADLPAGPIAEAPTPVTDTPAAQLAGTVAPPADPLVPDVDVPAPPAAGSKASGTDLPTARFPVAEPQASSQTGDGPSGQPDTRSPARRPRTTVVDRSQHGMYGSTVPVPVRTTTAGGFFGPRVVGSEQPTAVHEIGDVTDAPTTQTLPVVQSPAVRGVPVARERGLRRRVPGHLLIQVGVVLVITALVILKFG